MKIRSVPKGPRAGILFSLSAPSSFMLGLLLLAVAPALFLFWYVYRKDRYEPEPAGKLLKIFILGALAVIPAGLLELPFPEGVFVAAIVAPVVEEGLKFLVVFLFIYHDPEFDEPMDGIVYATAAGLGFATIENILYVLEGGVAVGIIRAVVSVPGHVIFSCIWGFALGTAKFRPGRERAGIVLAGLAGAMLLHGLFNASLGIFEAAGLALILLVLLPFGWWITNRNIARAHDDPASFCSAQRRAQEAASLPAAGPAPETLRYCTACGAPRREGDRFCAECGREY